MTDPAPPRKTFASLVSALTQPRRGRVQMIVGIGAAVMSLISLFVAVTANRTQEKLLAASSWPLLQASTSNSVQGRDEIVFTLDNAGIGPARIRSMELHYGGSAFKNALDYLRACCGADDQTRYLTERISRRVIKPGEAVNFLVFSRDNASPEVWEALNKERWKTRLTVCYCSVLDECWRYLSDGDEPEAIASCPRPRADYYN